MADASSGSRAAAAWIGTVGRAAAAWIGTVGRPVLARATPTWAGVAILAGVVMGGNGLAPADVVALASSSWRAVAVLGTAWLLLSSAAVRVGFDADGAPYLRSLPGGPAFERTTVVLAAAAVHLPWAALWFAGGGVAPGAAAWTAMTAASLAVVALAGRLDRAPATPRWRGPIAALAGVHARSLARRRLSALAAGAGMAALGGAFAALVIGHEARDARDAIVIAGAVASIGLAAALVAGTAAVAESDRQLDWLAHAAAISPASRRLGLALVLAGLGIGAGAIATLAAAAVTPLGATTLVAVAGTHALVGLGAGLAAVEVGVRARRADGVDGTRVAIGLLLVGVVGLVTIGIFHAIGVAAFVAVGAGAAAGGARPA